MDFHMRLPRRKREFALFIAVISIISVNIIAPLITCFEFGFSMSVWLDALSVMPVIWLAVVILVLLTYKPAERLTKKVCSHSDSFRATITINILCTVFLLSICLTVVGAWIGSKHLSMEPIVRFFHKWPRNFAIALGVELLIAQPFARFVMLKYHQHIDSKPAVSR